MGGSTSKNVANITTMAIANVATDIIQKSMMQDSAQQDIIINNTHGDVTIDGIHFNQKLTISMSNLMSALTKQEAQQKLAAQIAQAAKSLISGINLFNFSNASNEISTFMQASINIATHIANMCRSIVNTTQAVHINNTDKNVTVKNVIFEQVHSMFQSCIMNAVSQNNAVQNLQQKLDQIASSETKGFSVWALVAMLLLGLLFLSAPILLPLLGLGVMITKIMACVALVVIIVGIVLLIIGLKHTPKMTDYSFSEPISKTCSGHGQSYTPSQSDIKNAGDASEYCKTDQKCNGFDWIGVDIANNFSWSDHSPPETKFYQVPGQCQSLASSIDKSKLWKNPNFCTGNGNPASVSPSPSCNSIGDMYLDTKSTSVYRFGEDKEWVLETTIESAFNGTNNAVSWNESFSPPQSSKLNDIFVVYGNDELVVYKYNTDWDKIKTIEYNPVAHVPSNFNVSGIKSYVPKSKTMIMVGITMIVIGVIAAMYNVVMMYKKNKKEK